MNQDPFNNFKPLNSSNSRKKKRQIGSSFLEQIKSIGTSIGDSLATDVVKGTAKNIVEQLVNNSQLNLTPKTDQVDTSNIEAIIHQREEIARQEARQNAKQETKALFQQQRQQEKVVFSFRDEKLKQEIQAVRQDIAVLVKSMGKVQKQIEQAVIQEIVDPGLYHKNFFQNLRQRLAQLQKSLNDASLWLSISSNRKRGAYWTNSKKYGNQYSMSQEHQMARSVG